MKAINYTNARQHLTDTMFQVCESHTPIVITRRKEESVVMISLDDYEALEETAYLLRSPKNAKRLLDSIEQLEAGRCKKRKTRK